MLDGGVVGVSEWVRLDEGDEATDLGGEGGGEGGRGGWGGMGGGGVSECVSEWGEVR